MSFAGISFVSEGGLSTRSTPSAVTAAVTDSGYHLLVVDGYSRTKEAIKNGDWLESPPFRVGGHRWRIRYFPNGIDSESAEYMSLYLLLDDDEIDDDIAETTTVKAKFDFSLVDKAERQLPSDIQDIEVTNFSNECSFWGFDDFMKREDLEKSANLKDDRLIVKCDIIVIKDVDVDSTGANTAVFVVVPVASDMPQHLSSLLRSAEGSDVTFEIGGEMFAAHRCVLACRSTVFKGLLSGSMNEDTTKGVIRIDDMEARVFKLLLGFIYSDSVPENMEEEEDDVMLWQHLLVAADRFGLMRLRLICEQKLCTYISTTTATTILALAERYHGRGLKDACFDFLTRTDANLEEVLALGGLDRLASTCPLLLKELITKLVSSKKAKIDVNTAFVVVPASDMHQYFSQLLQSGEGTDVVFEISGEKIHAHRCMLAARSAVFRAELFGPMKEGTTTGVIHIDDMEARVFKLMLSFIYSDSMLDIGQETEYDDVDDVEVTTWQHLLVAADRYDLRRLRLKCEQKLWEYINVTTVANILELAEQRHCQGLKQACLDFLNFPPNLQQVMAAGGLNHLLSSSCPSVLIDLIAKLAYLKPDN